MHTPIHEMQGTWETPTGSLAMVASRFNELIVTRLVEGAKTVFLRQGLKPSQLDIVWVPGAFEIPLMCHSLAKAGGYVGIVALGAVIRGETAHFEYVSNACTQGVLQVQLQTGIPITFGVLTTENQDQALARAGGPVGNKGTEAAMALLEMIHLLSKIHG